jgi:hypothetical protein
VPNHEVRLNTRQLPHPRAKVDLPIRNGVVQSTGQYHSGVGRATAAELPSSKRITTSEMAMRTPKTPVVEHGGLNGIVRRAVVRGGYCSRCPVIEDAANARGVPVGAENPIHTEGTRIIRTPLSARANAFAERFVGTARRECLDRMLVFNRRQLEAVLSEFVDHYNSHRPHRSLGQASPLGTPPVAIPFPDSRRIRRSDRLGGLIHEYELAA